MRQFFFLITTLTFISSTFASTECEKAEASFWNRYAQLQKKYQTYTKDLSPLNHNEPTWTWGRKKQAVYLLHGFIGTPYEMSAIATILENNNYTVINDIIPGHGINGFVANQFTETDWKKHVDGNLLQIRKCFDKIHLIGFSTGGLILHDYVRRKKNNFQASSLTLYSPYYRPHFDYADLLAQATRLVTPVVLTKPLYYLTRFPDIKVAVVEPDHYLQQLPLDMASAVTSYGEKIYQQALKKPLQDETTPTLVFISKFDKIMDFDSTSTVIENDFPYADVYEFTENYAPHHLMAPAVHKNADFVFDETLQFIKSLH